MYNYYTHTKAELIALIRKLGGSANTSYSKTQLVSIYGKLRKHHLDNKDKVY